MRESRTTQIYQFKAGLRGVSPPVWRRIQVWADSTLHRLHHVLQLTMGWENNHLYEFHVAGARYGDPHAANEPEILNAKQTRLDRVLSHAGSTLEYQYDFGDNWLHDLHLEAILPRSPDGVYPCCIAGERSCPPEDVGGPSGYEDYLAALADPNHEEHEDMMTWRGSFDPEDSQPRVNQQLEKRFGSMRNRSALKAKATANPTG